MQFKIDRIKTSLARRAYEKRLRASGYSQREAVRAVSRMDNAECWRALGTAEKVLIVTKAIARSLT
ncbi:MAG: hypothetical protein J0L65_12610 [Xanthomonadales bacterium]|nr:hypothetical protein [Xanthomonadales bacterium]